MFKHKNAVGYKFYGFIDSHSKDNIIYCWHGKRYYRKYKKLKILYNRKPKYQARECLIFRNKFNRIKNITRLYKLK